MFKVGDKAKGFKFDDDTYPLIGWAEEMDDVVEVVGKVSYVGGESYSVHFKDSDVDWGYPKDLWYLAKVEETTSFDVGEDVSFKVGDKVKFKKSSIDSGMIDATEDDVFEVSAVFTTGLQIDRGDYFQVFAFCHLEHVKEELMNNTEEQEIKWEGSQIDWQVGQEVFCLLRGKGVIANTSYGGDYPIEVEFEKDFEYYTNDGKLFDYHKNRTLFFSEPKIIAEKFPPKKTFVPVLREGEMVVVNTVLGSIIHSVREETENHIRCNGQDYAKEKISGLYKLGEEIIFN